MKAKSVFRAVLSMGIVLFFALACTDEKEDVNPNTSLTATAENNKVTPVAGGITLDAVRHALDRFKDVKMAEKAGYVRTGDCISSPLGTMGVHWYNEKLASPTLHPMQPELLVYLPDGNGGMRLVAAEYFVWESDWQELHGEDAPWPTMFGQTFVRATHGVPPHYELHVWLWQHNPAGMFSNWNPAISCR